MVGPRHDGGHGHGAASQVDGVLRRHHARHVAPIPRAPHADPAGVHYLQVVSEVAGNVNFNRITSIVSIRSVIDQRHFELFHLNGPH